MIYSRLPQETYFVYILLCSDTSYYIGLTDDFPKRLEEHEEGKYPNCFTFKRRPLKLAYYETIPFLKEAIERQTQLRKWSRKKKEALMQQDYHRLHLLAACQNLTHYRYKHGFK